MEDCSIIIVDINQFKIVDMEKYNSGYQQVQNSGQWKIKKNCLYMKSVWWHVIFTRNVIGFDKLHGVGQLHTIFWQCTPKQCLTYEIKHLFFPNILYGKVKLQQDKFFICKYRTEGELETVQCNNLDMYMYK